MKGGEDVATHEVVLDQVNQHHRVHTLLKKLERARTALIQALPFATPKGKRFVLPNVKRLGVHNSGLHDLTTWENTPGDGVHMRRALIVGALVSSAVDSIVGDALKISQHFN